MDLTQTQLEKIAGARKLTSTTLEQWREEQNIADITTALAARSGVESYFIGELLDIIDQIAPQK